MPDDLQIDEIPASAAPMPLLLLADPSERQIRGYLADSRCFVALSAGQTVGACVVRPLGERRYELMNIAVDPGHQQGGIGSRLLRWLIDSLGRAGARQLEVGTGSFGYQLAFYQRQGFRVSRVDRDFFLEHYSEPIFEDGIQHRDMLRLSLDYPER